MSERVYEQRFNDAFTVNKYIGIVPMNLDGSIIGHTVLEVLLRKNSPYGVYPELLVDQKYVQPYWTKKFDYTVYVNQYPDQRNTFYNYDELSVDQLKNERLYHDGIVYEDYHYLAQQNGDGKTVVVISKKFGFK